MGSNDWNGREERRKKYLIKWEKKKKSVWMEREWENVEEMVWRVVGMEEESDHRLVFV